MNKTATVLAISMIMGSGLMAVAAQKDTDEIPLTLSGCVMAGQAKDSYMLTNVVIDGTTAAPTNAFYRFDTTKGLKNQVGRRVEVTGSADLDDMDKGKVHVKTDDDKTTTAVTSERRTVTVDQNVWAGSTGAMNMDMKADIATYKFKVKDVKRLEGDCSSAAAAQ
jgi:hypothetical protein